MERMKKQTILVSKKSYIYLQQRSRIERCGETLREARVKKLESVFNNLQYKGYVKLYDGDFGGKENGKLTSWSSNDMASILQKEHLDYKLGDTEEIINL